MQAMAISRTRWTILLALTGVLPTYLSGQQRERYTLSADEVAIYNLAGEVRVEAGSGPGVTTEVTRGGAEAGKLKVMKGGSDGEETLRVVYPGDQIQYGKLTDGSSTNLRVRDDGTFGDSHDGEKNQGRRVTIASRGGLDAFADLRVTVPLGKRVAIHQAVGKVSVTNVHGDLSIEVAAAPVTVSGSRGELSIEVGSGAVQVSQVRGELSVDTGSGPVGLSDVRGKSISVATGSGDVTVSAVRSSELSVETGSGNIQVTGLIAPHVKLETGSGAVAADLSGEVWEVSVETGSGDVTLKVPPTLGAEVDIETSSGEIETDFEVAVTRHSRDHITGRIGDGSGKIDIETGSGGIKLVKGP